MSLVVHHLHRSQSERVVWLCEELGIPYTLRIYDRAPLLAPPELKNIPGNVLGSAPLLQVFDEGTDVNSAGATPQLTLCESGAIVEYILGRHSGSSGAGEPRPLTVAPSAPNYADYLYWFHAANGTLQAQAARAMFFIAAGLPADGPLMQNTQQRVGMLLRHMDAQLGRTGAFLAGAELTAADIMTVFSLTTGRYYWPFSLAEYPNILAYLRRVGERPAYKRAMEKGDQGMELLLGAEAPAEPYQATIGKNTFGGK